MSSLTALLHVIRLTCAWRIVTGTRGPSPTPFVRARAPYESAATCIACAHRSGRPSMSQRCSLRNAGRGVELIVKSRTGSATCLFSSYSLTARAASARCPPVCLLYWCRSACFTQLLVSVCLLYWYRSACFTQLLVYERAASARCPPVCLLFWCRSACFTGTIVQILTKR